MFDFSGLAGSDAQPSQIAVNAETQEALMAMLRAHLAEAQGFSLATLNLDHLVKIVRDPAFRAAYAAHTIVTADGNPIVWLCRLAGQRVRLIPGSELVHPVAGLAAELDVPVALLGSTDAALDGAAAALERAHPGLRVVARIAPPMGFEPDGQSGTEAIASLKASEARLCFLALGAPRQERFAARAQTELPQTGFLSIGAGLDFLSGHQKRAPRIVRQLALEWLWRLLSNPGRLTQRYVACFAVLPRAVRLALKTRGGRHL